MAAFYTASSTSPWVLVRGRAFCAGPSKIGEKTVRPHRPFWAKILPDRCVSACEYDRERLRHDYEDVVYTGNDRYYFKFERIRKTWPKKLRAVFVSMRTQRNVSKRFICINKIIKLIQI